MAHLPARWKVELLHPSHGREGFSCGEEMLDRYLKKQAGQDMKRHLASVFVLIESGSTTVSGYYSLSVTSIEAGDLPTELARRLPRYDRLPATLIGRLAVAKPLHGTGLGSALLADALMRTWQCTREIGSLAVVVDALHEKACLFYERFGFTPFPTHPLKLFLPMKTVAHMTRNATR